MGRSRVVIGFPSRYALGVALRNWVLAAGSASLAAGSAWAWWLTENGRTGSPAWAAPAALAVAAASAAVTATAHRRASRAWAGVVSEAKVWWRLRSVPAAAQVHGADLGAGGDADHILLGPVAVVVETKTGYGRVVCGPGSMTAGGRVIPGDPVRQAVRQAAALSRILGGVWVDAVVCVVGMRGEPFRVDGAWVCGLDDLKDLILRLPRRIDRRRAVAAAESIAARAGR